MNQWFKKQDIGRKFIRWGLVISVALILAQPAWYFLKWVGADIPKFGIPKLFQPEWQLVYPANTKPGTLHPVRCKNGSGYHETWKCVDFVIHPDILENTARVQELKEIYWDVTRFRMYNEPPSGHIDPVSFNRLPTPTLVYQHRDRPGRYILSIDGTNEASDGMNGRASPYASHTTEGKGVLSARDNAIVSVCYVGGYLSDALGNRMPFQEGFSGSSAPWTAVSYQITTPSNYRDAVFFRLRTASGRATPWMKMSYSGEARRCIRMRNDLGGPAHLDIKNNAEFMWWSHLTGKPRLELDYGAKGWGWNGDRVRYAVEFPQ